MESARRYSSTTRAGVYGGFFLNGNQMRPDHESLGSGTQEEAREAGKESGSADSLAARLEEMRTRLNGFSSRVIAGRTVIGSRNTMGLMGSIRDQSFQYLFQALFRGSRGSLYYGASLNSRTGMGFGQMNTPAGGDIMSLPGGGSVRTTEFVQMYQYEETELTTFSTQGTVKCADGREISFNLNLQMSRSFQQYYEERFVMSEVNFCDPLVINLDGNITDLSDQTFLFDIDSDGEQDNISRLSQGSGYLALDKNGDGTVNDGSELFGTASGNGFADLAKYDNDGNGWIDEGDEIWNKLKIWIMDENGESQLYSLAEKGLGAICLMNMGTDFTLTDEDNAAKGMIRQSGVFLYENGAVGSVQQVDVAKYDNVS